jgi:hypothetical protein
MAARNRDQVIATLNKVSIQSKNCKDTTQARTDALAELRKLGPAGSEFADRAEGKGGFRR